MAKANHLKMGRDTETRGHSEWLKMKHLDSIRVIRGNSVVKKTASRRTNVLGIGRKLSNTRHRTIQLTLQIFWCWFDDREALHN